MPVAKALTSDMGSTSRKIMSVIVMDDQNRGGMGLRSGLVTVLAPGRRVWPLHTQFSRVSI